MTHDGGLTPPRRESRSRAAGRWPYGAGNRFIILMVAGFAWIGPAWFDARFLWALLAWDLVLCGAWVFDLRRLPMPDHLVVSREWSAPAALTTPVPIEVAVRNEGSRWIEVDLVDDVPETLSPEHPRLRMAAAAGAVGRAAYVARPLARGDTLFGQAHLRYRGALSLAERWAVADLSQTVRVYPDLDQSRRHAIYLIRSRQIDMERRLQRLRGKGREFESLREYRDGDQWRDICWTATARRGRLITKVSQTERNQVIWLLVDSGRLMRSRAGGPSKLDHAVNAALSLAHLALHSGDRVALLAYGRQAQQRVAPDRSARHLRSLVEALAQVREERSEADHLRAARLLLTLQKQRCLVFWLTDLPESAAVPDVAEGALRLSGRHVVVFVAIAQPELGQAAAAVPATIESMYHHVAAQEVLLRRGLQLRSLRRRGVLAMESEPGGLSTLLVSQYLEVKDRGLI